MQIDQTNYKRWSFIVALTLALILLLMLFFGFGPSAACCDLPPTDTLPISQISPPNDASDNLTNEKAKETALASAPTIIVNEPFSFTASSQEISTKGNSNNVAWLSKADALKTLLSGEDLRAHGNEQTITLTGLVDSESVKLEKSAAALAFFGSSITVNNQMVVKSGVALNAEMATATTIKIYFASNKSNLSNAGAATLKPLISRLNKHPEYRVVIKGFHDATGSAENNLNIAKNRAKTVYEALLAEGINSEQIEMSEPSNALGSGELKEARRVEVTIQ